MYTVTKIGLVSGFLIAILGLMGSTVYNTLTDTRPPLGEGVTDADYGYITEMAHINQSLFQERYNLTLNEFEVQEIFAGNWRPSIGEVGKPVLVGLPDNITEVNYIVVGVNGIPVTQLVYSETGVELPVFEDQPATQ